MPDYFIGCDTTPSTTTNGVWVRCRVEESIVYTEQEVSGLYSPPMSLADAHLVGAALYTFLFVVWKGKQFSRLALGGTRP